ncbi:MAG: ATP-binding protein [Gemmatimonadota bacterium]|nr:ATP-binding protein [Gemmatimonadota bacterium]
MTERSMRTTATVEHLPALVEFLQRAWQEGALPEAAAFPFELALDEIFMNVVMHGTTPDGPPREVVVSLRDEGNRVTMVMEDDGPAFDPLTLATPDIDAPIEERELGGLGVFLVRELMDDVSYAHTGTHNQLTMHKVVS